jgi:hypothetical protein
MCATYAALMNARPSLPARTLRDLRCGLRLALAKVHALTIEAMAPSAACVSPFREARDEGPNPNAQANIRTRTPQALTRTQTGIVTLNPTQTPNSFREPRRVRAARSPPPTRLLRPTRCRSQALAFRHRPSDFASYGHDSSSTGKSFGVLHHATLRGDGPHHFFRNGEAGPASVSANGSFARTSMHVLPPRVAVTLHYESCDYARWRRKFREAGAYQRRQHEVKRKQFEQWCHDNFDDHETDPDAQRARLAFFRDDPWAAEYTNAPIDEPAAAGAFGHAPPPVQRQGYKQRFYAASDRVCVAELDAEASGDAGAMRRAAEASLRVWSDAKVPPSGWPRLPDGQDHLVLPDLGVTLIRPPGSRLQPETGARAVAHASVSAASAPSCSSFAAAPSADAVTVAHGPAARASVSTAGGCDVRHTAAAQLHALLDAAAVPRDTASALLTVAATMCGAGCSAGGSAGSDIEAHAATLVVETLCSHDRAKVDELLRGAGLRVGHRLKLVTAAARQPRATWNGG